MTYKYDEENPDNKPPPNLRKFVEGKDLSRRNDRLAFFKEWTGGADPDHITRVTITRKDARWLLDPRNHLINEDRHQNKSSARVQSYIKLMRRGWKPHCGIQMVYTKEGRFGNAYSRLTALANCPPGTVLTDVPITGPYSDEKVCYLEATGHRTANDQLCIKWSVEKARQPSLFVHTRAIIRDHLLEGMDNRPRWKEHLYEAEALDDKYFRAYCILHEIVQGTIALQSFRRPEVMAAFSYAYVSEVDPVRELWETLVKGSGLACGTATHTLFMQISGTQNRTKAAKLAFMRRLFHGIKVALSPRPLLKTLSGKFHHVFDDEVWLAEYQKLAVEG